ncbi:hypothetical protein AB1Y20_007844 [Prymnesium parvum]|uniref:Uncharacterized protein n=1 Tax=Prymnesium parvum TaxID=97485 RepID=A0AB34ISZ8_PRYPA|mmetsp:Transcript_27510/g.68383  ORF Transcript_27510/g.68383 Transcript_27510/m.68383 type:complete len:356 (+) Transcript_27510:14-1081(+)
MVIEYDPSASVFRTLCSWTGTILQLVLCKPMIYVLLAMHALFIVADFLLWRYHTNWEADADGWQSGTRQLPKLSWSAGALATSLLVFFIVFYGSQSYSRFYALYGHCIGLGGATMEWTALVKLHLIQEPAARWNAVRFILAAMHIMYFGLREVGAVAGIDDEEWATIRNRQLLTDGEISTLKNYKGYLPFLPVQWAMLEAEKQLLMEDPTDSKSETLLHQQLQEKAFAFRGHCGQITNLLKQPVPFPYFHVLNLMIVVTLTLVAYMLVPMGIWPLTMIIQFVASLVLLGLKEVAVCLADPFGDDAVDFNVDTFLLAAYKNAIANLNDDHAPHGSTMPSEITNPIKGNASLARKSV